jgi:hypothetical protein
MDARVIEGCSCFRKSGIEHGKLSFAIYIEAP